MRNTRRLMSTSVPIHPRISKVGQSHAWGSNSCTRYIARTVIYEEWF